MQIGHETCSVDAMTQADYLLNADGTARDPKAFQAALRKDQAKLDVLRSEPETLAVMIGDDIPALQNMLKSAFEVQISLHMWPLALTTVNNGAITRDALQAEQARRKRQHKKLRERTIDAQRVDATVPRLAPRHFLQCRSAALDICDINVMELKIPSKDTNKVRTHQHAYIRLPMHAGTLCSCMSSCTSQACSMGQPSGYYGMCMSQMCRLGLACSYP